MIEKLHEISMVLGEQKYYIVLVIFMGVMAVVFSKYKVMFVALQWIILSSQITYIFTYRRRLGCEE